MTSAAIPASIATVPRQEAAPPGLLDRERRGLTIGLLLTVTLIAFEALAVATVMPNVKQDLGGLALYGWAFSGFLLATMVGIIAGGEQADRYGPARPFAIALALFAGGLAIGGLAPSMLVLVLGRAMQGFGAGVLLSVIYAIIGRGYSETLRPQMFAAMSSAWIVPGLIGPAIAGVTADVLSWRLIFLGLLPLTAIGYLLTAPALHHFVRIAPDAPPDGRVRIALRLALGVALVLGGATSGVWFVAAPMIIAGAAIAWPALSRLVPPGTMRAAAGVPAAALTTGLLNMAFFGAEAFLPFLIVEVRDAPAVLAGLALTAATLTWTAGSWLQARFDGRIQRQTLIASGLALVAVGVACTIPATSDAVPVTITIPAWAIAGLGMGLGFPSVSLFVLAHAAPGSEGSSSASLKLMEVLGGALGAGIGGAIVAIAGDAWDARGIALAFAIMSGAAAIGLLAARRIGHDRAMTLRAAA